MNFNTTAKHEINKIKRDADLAKLAIDAGSLDHAELFLLALHRQVGQLTGLVMAEQENRREAAKARAFQRVMVEMAHRSV